MLYVTSYVCMHVYILLSHTNTLRLDHIVALSIHTIVVVGNGYNIVCNLALWDCWWPLALWLCWIAGLEPYYIFVEEGREGRDSARVAMYRSHLLLYCKFPTS